MLLILKIMQKQKSKLRLVKILLQCKLHNVIFFGPIFSNLATLTEQGCVKYGSPLSGPRSCVSLHPRYFMCISDIFDAASLPCGTQKCPLFILENRQILKRVIKLNFFEK